MEDENEDESEERKEGRREKGAARKKVQEREE